MNAASYLLDNGLSSDKVLLLTRQGDFSHVQVREAAFRVAAWLGSSGLRKGDRVLIVAEASFFWVVSYLAVLLAGAVAVPVPGNTKPQKLGKIFTQVEPRAAFVQARHREGLLSVFRRDGMLVLDECAGKRSDCQVDLQWILDRAPSGELAGKSCMLDEKIDLASIMFTSGTSGEPNGVMITHRNIIANTDSTIRYMDLTEQDRVMAILPFHYCYGLSLLHTHLKVGGSLVIENSFVFPEMVLSRMEETECTGFAGVPGNYQILLRNSTLAKRKLSHLRYVQQAGGKLPDIFIKELRKALPEAKVFIMYGQTEATARLSFLPPDLLEKKLGSIGKGIPGVTLKVVDEKGLPVRGTAVGEIVATGDNVSLGYWGNEGATKGKFRDGELFTGDLARVDEDGFIFIVDRAADFLKCGGLRISCKEIEDVVHQFPGTIEAAVVPQPDIHLGEAVRLYVVHEKGESVSGDLKNHCTANLEWSFTPRKIIFLSSLPKTSSGKVDRQVLKHSVFDAGSATQDRGNGTDLPDEPGIEFERVQ